MPNLNEQCDACGGYFPAHAIHAVGPDDELMCEECTTVADCDCCGKRRPVFRCMAYGIETFACEECTS